jgi:K+-transporting ATPase ATPase B chain
VKPYCSTRIHSAQPAIGNSTNRTIGKARASRYRSIVGDDEVEREERDLDSNPTKLLEVVTVGKQMLMTRGALTTFSIANDVSKYFAIIPSAFVGTYPQLKALDVMGLRSPASAVLSAVLFNALIIIVLIPIALRGIKIRPAPAAAVLRRNLLVFGLGGLVLPFPCIKLIDVIISGLGLLP